MNSTFRNFVLGAALVAGWASTAEAQQVFRRSQFFVNPYLSNPAVAGTLPESPISASFRNQWAGFDGAPRTNTLSGHTSLPNRFGLGGVIYSDNTGGAIKQSGVEVTGSYTIDLNNYDAVSFGLSLMANQWSFDNDLEVWDVEDPALQWGMEQSMSLDANFGMMIFGEAYSFGFAIPQLLQTKSGLSPSPNASSNNENSLFRHFRFMGRYAYDVNKDFALEASGLVRFTAVTPAQLDVYIKGTYAQAAWVMLGMRAGDAVLVGTGVNVDQFGLAYTYDITSTDARLFSPHTHELTLTYFMPRSGGFSSRSLNSKRIIGRSRLVR
jgi:type IX secretion system PorP/SprF family membrane protein